MAFKFVLFAVFITIANAGFLGTAPAPIATTYHTGPLARIATPVLTQRLAPQVFAAPIAHSVAPVAPIAKTVVDTDFDPNPQYSYAYEIQDALTGDSKNHFESRSGDVVQGQYSLIDPDGTRRTVDYTADPINGFNAVVHREPLVKAVAAAPVAKIATPIATPFAAPIATPFAAPLPAPIAARQFFPFH